MTSDDPILSRQQPVPNDTPAPSGVSLGAFPPPTGPALYPFLEPAVEADEIGRLGNFRVLRLLGTGGMGMVFHAEDLTLRRPVALKVMRPDVGGDAESWPRFLREARALAAIRDEHLVTIYHAAQDGPVVYLALELLQGESLEDRMKRPPPLTLAAILRLAREIATGLAVIHRSGIVHRDIKPANLWLEAPDGKVKILDFGLARVNTEETRLTHSGLVVGTPAFMSPEQASEKPVDARSDLFSLGCILYALCTGFRPFQGQTTMALLTALAVEDPRPVHQLNPAIPEALSGLIMQLLAKDPQDRPASAEAVVECVRQIESGHGVPVAQRVGARRDQALALVRKHGRKLAAAAGGFVFLVLVLLAFGRSGKAPQVAPTATQPREKVYLAELVPSERNLKLPPLPPPPKDGPGKGPPPPPPRWEDHLRVNGKFIQHGLFMQAEPPDRPPAFLSYALEGKYAAFHTQVALNDTAENEGKVYFAVIVDGERVWKSAGLTAPGKVLSWSGPVKGKKELRLELTTDGDIRGTHGVWIDPYLEK